MTNEELTKELKKWIEIAEERKNRLEEIAQFSITSMYSDKEILYFIRQVALGNRQFPTEYDGRGRS